jgi:hypothetical protein
MSKFLIATLLLFVLGGCLVEETRSVAEEKASTPQLRTADSATLHAVADDRTAGSRPQVQFDYKDPKSGTTYLINPQWRIVQRAPKGLAKTNGLLQTWTDWSGQVETRIYECTSPTKAQHQNSIGCQVEPGFILVGGGAYADYGTGGAGAMLWETRPLDENLVTWVASSKDHISPNSHSLSTYAIGMRLKNNAGTYIPKSSLLNSHIMFRTETSSPPAHFAFYSLQSYVSSGFWWDALYLGGGARMNWNCCGALLNKSLVENHGHASQYRGSGKDHGSSDPSTISVYGVFTLNSWDPDYPRQSFPIEGFGTLDFKVATSNGNNVSTGVATALVDVESEYVITGPGGEAKATSGPGRLLYGIKPTGTHSGQIGVYSKDHKSVSGGYNIASIMQVRKKH